MGCMQDVAAVSRSGLVDEPLYPIQIGSLHLLRLRVAAGTQNGRLSLMVDGVSNARIFTTASDPGVDLKVQNMEPEQPSEFCNCSSWSSGILLSGIAEIWVRNAS